MLKCIARDSLSLFYPPSWEVERESKYGLTDSAADNDGEKRGGSLGCSAPWLGIDRREDGKQKRGKRNDKKPGLSKEEREGTKKEKAHLSRRLSLDYIRFFLLCPQISDRSDRYGAFNVSRRRINFPI